MARVGEKQAWESRWREDAVISLAAPKGDSDWRRPAVSLKRYPDTKKRRPESLAHHLASERGSALLEFALVVPLLVVFVVGIFDFSGAFNQKQKVAQAAQEGAILAAAQPMSDIVANGTAPPNNPDSLLADVTAIFDSLAGSGVLPNANQGSCVPPSGPSSQSGLTWTYTIGGCAGGTSGDDLVVTINRGWVSGAHSASGSLSSVGTSVNVAYPYHWRFNGVIQLLFPGANYAATTSITETAIVHNQI